MRKFSLMLLVLTCVVFGAVACATPPESPQQATARDVNSCLQLSLNVPSRNQQTRETSFALKLTNTCDRSLSFFVGGDPSYDVQITSLADEVIWNLLGETDRDDSQSTLELQAGQARTFNVTWDQEDSGNVPVKAGEYLAVGTIDISTNDGSHLLLRTKLVTFSINPSL